MKRALQHVVVVIFGLLFGLLLAEIGARIFYPLPEELKTSETIKVGLPPPYIQYVDRMPWSNSITHYEIEDEYSTIVSINSQGLRGPEVPYDKPVGEFRILYIGDSFVEAIQVDFEETVYQQLDMRLKKLPTTYKVIGAGEAGWGTDQAYLYYRYEGYRYQPDLVIYQFVPNDVSNNVRDTYFRRPEGLRQHFTLKEGKLMMRNLLIQTSPWYRYLIALHRHLLLSSRLYALISDLRPGKGATFLAQPVYNRVEEPAAETKGSQPSPTMFIYQQPYSDEYKAAWELTEAILAEWADRVRTDGAIFAIVSVPGRWVTTEEDWQALPRDFPSLASEFAHWNPDKPDEYLSDISRRYDILYLSLTPAFWAEAAKSGPRFYVSDGHWSAAGHALAAQTIFNWLLEQEWFEAKPNQVQCLDSDKC